MSRETEDWLSAMERRDRLADLRDVLLAFIIAMVCFCALWASAAEVVDGPHILPGDVPVLDVSSAHIVLPDGGCVDVQGGGWLRDDVLMSRARELVATQAELDALKKTPRPVASTPLVVITNILTGILQAAAATGTACLAATGNAFCFKK